MDIDIAVINNTMHI